MTTTRQLARLLRLGVIKNILLQEKLTENDAKILLSGNLTPEDDSTFCDDSLLLELPYEQAKAKIEAE